VAPRPSASIVVAHSSTPVRISGGTPRERALLRLIVARSGVSSVVAAHLGGPTGGFHQPGVWLRLTVAVTSPNKAMAIPPLWQGEIIEGAYRALSVRDGLPDLTGVVYVRLLPTGRTIPWNAGVAGGDAPRAHASPVFASRSRIQARADSAAAAAGWRVRRITLFRPDGFAVEVALVAAHPQGFGAQLSAFERRMSLRGLTGALIEVENPCGATVYQQASARWIGMYTNSADPRWLCPNPAVSLPGGCPAPATKPC
jgi:hypothetical protein